MRFPSIGGKLGWRRCGRASTLGRGTAVKGPMNAIGIVVIPEVIELSREVNRVPEERAIKILSPNRPNQSFDERVRNRRVRNRLNFLDFQYA